MAVQIGEKRVVRVGEWERRCWEGNWWVVRMCAGMRYVRICSRFLVAEVWQMERDWLR